MKVSDVQTYIANAGWRNFVFVRVLTDDGLEGVGEATFLGSRAAAEAAVKQLASRYVIGRSPFDIEEGILQLAYRNEWVRPEPIVMSALGGLEMADGTSSVRLLTSPSTICLADAFEARLRLTLTAGGREIASPAALLSPRDWSRIRVTKRSSWIPSLKAAKCLRKSFCPSTLSRRSETPWVPTCTFLLSVTGASVLARRWKIYHLIEPFRPYWLEEPTDPENIGALQASRAQS